MEGNQRNIDQKTTDKQECTEEKVSIPDLVASPIFLMCILLGGFFIYDLARMLFGWNILAP